jgi:hypothetical protein
MSPAASPEHVAFDLRVEFRAIGVGQGGFDLANMPIAPEGVLFAEHRAGDRRISLEGRLGPPDRHDSLVWSFLEKRLGSAQAVMDISTQFLTEQADFFEALAQARAVEISLNCEQSQTVDLPDDFLQVLGRLNRTIRFCFHADSEA